jgi:hypothetical protein
MFRPMAPTSETLVFNAFDSSGSNGASDRRCDRIALSKAPTFTGSVIAAWCVVRGRKCSNKVRDDIVLGATCCNRVSENASADFPGRVRSIDDAQSFDPLQDLEQIRRLNRSNRFAPEVGNHPLVDLLPIPRPRRFSKRSLLRQQPFISYG